jgi:hypothetical protein
VRRTTQKTFWDRVREAMLDARMKPTQKGAADLIGIKQPSVNDWTKPGGYPTIDNAVALAQKLNVCVEWLMTERGPKRPLPEDVTAQVLWELWPRVDDDAKREIVRLAAGRLRSPPSDDEAASERRA